MYVSASWKALLWIKALPDALRTVWFLGSRLDLVVQLRGEGLGCTIEQTRRLASSFPLVV